MFPVLAVPAVKSTPITARRHDLLDSLRVCENGIEIMGETVNIYGYEYVKGGCPLGFREGSAFSWGEIEGGKLCIVGYLQGVRIAIGVQQIQQGHKLAFPDFLFETLRNCCADRDSRTLNRTVSGATCGYRDGEQLTLDLWARLRVRRASRRWWGLRNSMDRSRSKRSRDWLSNVMRGRGEIWTRVVE